MELELFLNYVGNSLKKINSDVEKLHSNLYNNDDILDHISSEVIMLENHIQYFSQINQAALEEDDNSVPGGSTTPGGSTVPGENTVPGGGIIPGGSTVPGGSAVPGGNTVPGGSTVPGGNTVPGGGTVPGEGTIPDEGTVPEEEEPRVFTLDELAQYTGKDGQPAYVAVNGVVYNVTNNPLWAGGNHFFGLTAGRDLTNEFQMCHPGAIVLSVLPVVGTLAEE